MKKAYKYTLAAVGIPLLCFAALALDSYFRAVSAIAAHDARLAKDIAAARSGHPSPAPDAYTFEGGHSGQNSDRLIPTDRMILKALNSASFEGLLNSLELLQDSLREGGYSIVYYRSNFEGSLLRRLRERLSDQRLPQLELGILSRSFDRICSGRPTVADIITAQHLRDRAEVLNVLHRKQDSYVMIRRPPGWREFFSWRILIAKALLQLDDHYREVLPLASLPLSGAEEAASKWGGWTEQENVLARTHLRLSAAAILKNERQVAAHWQVTRLALALSLFQSERGRNPKDLGELVPDYLPNLPVSPVDGAPYELRGGELHDVGTNVRWRPAPG